MGRTYSALHAGACISCLPLGSATMARMNPACTYTYENYQLHSILCCLVGKQLPFPWEETTTNTEDDAQVIELAGFATTEEFDAWLAQEWIDDYGRNFSL